MLTLGLDIGTSGIRAALFDARTGRLVRFARRAYVRSQDRADPDVWEALLEAVLSELAPEAGAAERIAIAGTSGTILAVDEAGRPLGPASMYDEAAEPQDMAVCLALAPQDSPARGTGSPLARARGLIARHPGARLRHQADHILALLTGVGDITDETSALKTGYDPAARAWPDWTVAAGLPEAARPRVVPSGTPVAPVSAASARRFGLSPEALVTAGVTDGCAAFLAAGGAGPGDAVVSVGSTLVLKIMSDRPVADPARGVYSHRLLGRWLAGGASNAGGAALARHFSRAEIERLTPRLDPDRPTGLLYHPLAGRGERFPVADPAMEPILTPQAPSREVFLQALLESLVRIEADGWRTLETLGAPPPASIRAVGGVLANPVYRRLRERAFGSRLAPACHDEAAVGAAILAARGGETG